MTSNAGHIIKLAIILFVVAAATSGILGGVNAITEDPIEEIRLANTAAAFADVLPTDSEYATVEYTDATGAVTGVFEAPEGYVIQLLVSGSQGMIDMVVGVNMDGVVQGVSLIDHAETPGLGAKADEASFRDQFVGAEGFVAVTKDGGEIASISGATVTSRAVANAVSIATELVAAMA